MLQERAGEVAAPPWTLRGDATVIPFRRGVLAFLRYAESNVGPYDELLWLAPFRRGPGGRANRVSAIFVSSEASVRGGRANWGLPKQLAVFRVSRQQGELERVEVTVEGQALASFVRHCPRGVLPLDASKLPRRVRRLVQLHEGRYFETVPEARGKLQLTRVAELEVNRLLLPDAHSSPGRLAVHLSELELRVPAARIFEAPESGGERDAVAPRSVRL